MPAKKLPLTGIFVVFVVIAVFLSAIIFLLKDVKFKKAPQEQTSLEITEIEKERGDGVITGSLGYPSEFIPENMEVCAVEVQGQGAHCSNNHLKDKAFTYGVGYRLTLPAGEYYVYAYVPNQPDATGQIYKAYYSEFVTCGMDVSCSNHEPVKVTVRQGEVTANVDPQDWYK
ncbi:MAG: hypothetical protein UV83_C0001G0325 [candidate division WWE3 bacterium GW2011_GWE2_43_18]|nr:MAG: hypothetical protein UU91_C0004G0104 [candidate division WWE3 bacterium GW2011_GWB1_42_117]KKS55522.1 MAG: hypothetical protein UV21_C0001G0104 [candidate division WWE3 bacterium GW2011_GWD2_42_34]KKT06007.1 MAG: hypothetical protein UV83_C0001G0325 [candidate division WWE3 bacterium GW2011_GWE2_43_18]KKT06925.1 MAG: hypothetical protein UV84_C0003G0061 [candidate division WWE3 bacterium GW2011_GWF2_43_18]KKT08805.1 MAG: hypothetical protein UV87_C0002G0148 [candidate division WWE3 bact